MVRNKYFTHMLPCISKNHTVWNVQEMRPWLGHQLMMAQGFPKSMKLEFDPTDESIPKHIRDTISKRLKKRKVSDLDLKHMAGNTMTIPVMGILEVGQGAPNN